MTNKELQLLDELDYIRRTLKTNFDVVDVTAFLKIKSLITEYFNNSTTGDKLYAVISERNPLCDYDIRLIEAIIATSFGYTNRNDWTKELMNYESKYKKYIKE